MDELRELSMSDKQRLRLHIYSDRLLDQTRNCPDDGAWMKATGHMYFRESVSNWIVEFACPEHGEIIPSWSPKLDAVTKQIAQDVLIGDNGEG